MALLADDTTPRWQVRDAAYYARLRDKLNAPIQAIPSGTGSLSPEGRPALPPWVQEKLDEEKRKEAEADARRRLSPVNQSPIAPAPPAKRPKIAPSLPKPARTPRFTAPAAPAPAVDRAFQRGTPEYNARINEVLQSRTQGVAPGYGSPSAPGKAAKRTEPKQPTLTEMLGPNGGGFGSAVPVSSLPPNTTQELPRPFSPGDDELAAGRVLSADDLWDADYVPERVRQTQALVFDVDEVEPMGSPARRVDFRPPEATDFPEDRWLLPAEIMGVPVTIDRELVQIAHQANTIFGITPEQQGKLDALPQDQREDIEDLARELWVESQGQALAEHKGRELGEAQPNAAFTHWKKIFELSTGYDVPDGGGWKPLTRDLIDLRDGFNFIDAFSGSDRNGNIVIFEPSLQDEEDDALLQQILQGTYPDERARFEAVKEHFPTARFVVDTAGAGTEWRESLENHSPIGDVAANFIGKATSPVTWALGPAGWASIVPGGIASNLYEESRELGLSPEEAFAATQYAMYRVLGKGTNRGAAWAYGREGLGDRVDDFDQDWRAVAPGVYPEREESHVENVFERRRRRRQERREIELPERDGGSMPTNRGGRPPRPGQR